MSKQPDPSLSCGEAHEPVAPGVTRRAFATGALAAGALTVVGAAHSTGRPAPAAVMEIETAWIPMPDGARLAARLWLPADAERHPVPAILEYLPYRRRDFERATDDMHHPAWAANGYACLRVDIRGTGDSDGAPQDEYVQREQDDALAVIDWIAHQPWCSGQVGLVGYSWGGINSLQIAARRPPALKAVLTLCSTPDRFGGDAHYKGGSILVDQMLWGAMWLAFQGLPPDPASVGAEWRTRWQSRLEAIDFGLADWLSHPTRDEFWKHASVSEDYAAVTCPVYAIGGWADPYSHWVMALLEGLRCPRKGLIGPWNHAYPDAGEPGPTIDFVAESLRWWDHWLKGRDTGVMREPQLRAWLPDRPTVAGDELSPGRWIAEATWPSAQVGTVEFHLTPARTLAPVAGSAGVLPVPAATVVGASAGRWAAFEPRIDLPTDQSVDDGVSLCFDTPPLEDDLEVLGCARLDLLVTVDRPVATLVARLNDVSPGGESRRMSYAVLNLCHRDGDESPRLMEVGRPTAVRLRFNAAACRLAKGHRIRVALSTTYWPIVIPPPHAVAAAILVPGSRVTLPVRKGGASVRPLTALAAPAAPVATYDELPAEPDVAIAERDELTGTLRLHRASSGGIRLHASATQVTRRIEQNLVCEAPASGQVSVEYAVSFGLARPGWSANVGSRVRLVTTADAFLLTGSLLAQGDGGAVSERSFERRIPRKLV